MFVEGQTKVTDARRAEGTRGQRRGSGGIKLEWMGSARHGGTQASVQSVRMRARHMAVKLLKAPAYLCNGDQWCLERIDT